MATLYRRFPTKEALVGEVFSHQFDTCVSVVDDALADPDPWRGFVTLVEKVGEMQACDRGFSAAVATAFPADVAAERALGRVTELIDRAKAAGELRADFAVTDLALVLMANDGVTADSPAATRTASRRLVAYLLNSFRAEHAGVPLPPCGTHERPAGVSVVRASGRRCPRAPAPGPPRTTGPGGRRRAASRLRPSPG